MSNKPGLLNLLAGKTQLVKKNLNSFLLLVLCRLVNSFNDWEMTGSQLRAGQEQGSEEIQLKIVVAYNENE